LPGHGDHGLLAEQAAQGHHLHLQVVVEHDAAGPGALEQRIAGDRPSAGLDEGQQQVEGTLADA